MIRTLLRALSLLVVCGCGSSQNGPDTGPAKSAQLDAALLDGRAAFDNDPLRAAQFNTIRGGCQGPPSLGPLRCDLRASSSTFPRVARDPVGRCTRTRATIPERPWTIAAHLMDGPS